MKKTAVLCLMFLVTGISLSAQEVRNSVSVGDLLEIQKPKGIDFMHVQFPRRNIIIKQGGIAHMKSLYGQKVRVTEVNDIPDGNTEVVLKLFNGRRFFGYMPSVKANLNPALSSGELKLAAPEQKEALANR
jgi:hypothetical protein